MANVVRKEMYVKSDVNNNNNKFWEVTITDDGTCVTRWGRVGDSGQSKSFNYGNVASANSFADSKIREKIRDGRNGEIAYRKIDVIGSSTTTNSASSIKAVNNNDLAKIASSQIKTNNPIVDDLVRYLSRVNAHQITSASGGKITYNDTTGLFSTPIGLVTQSNIDEANSILMKIGDIVSIRDYDNKDIINLTNSFLMLVPQDIGRHRLDVREFWSDTSKLQYQKGILDGLQASIIAASKNPVKNIDKSNSIEEKVFDLQLSLIEDRTVIKALSDKYESSKKHGHASYNYRVKTIYSVRIAGERERFEEKGRPIGNINQFFHGSSSANLLSIMKQGLIVPPKSSPHVCGRMYGDGCYFAPSSSKSLNYSIGAWGGKACDRIFMFIADVAMGKPYIPGKSGNAHHYPVAGYDSVWAKGGVSGVINDECIVYKTSQCSLTYLLELTNK